MEHQDAAHKLLKQIEESTERPELLLAAAGVHAVLHLADVVGHGLRDLVYEMRT